MGVFMAGKVRKGGYKSPPKDRQFKPGQSGNPTGDRKKRAQSLGEVFLKEGERRRRLPVGGKMVTISQAGILAKQQYAKAMKGDTNAFETIVKHEARRMGESAQPLCSADFIDPLTGQWNVERVLEGRPLASHCDECGKPLYEENERALREYEEQGYVAPSIHYNGPVDDGEIERLRAFEERHFSNRKPPRYVESEHGPCSVSKKRRKGSVPSLAELLVKEGNRRHRVAVDGRMVRLTQREIAARQQMAKAMKGDTRAIAIFAKYEAQRKSKPVLPNHPGIPFNLANLYDSDTGRLVIKCDLDERRPASYCDECRKTLDAMCAAEMKKHGLD